jgi:hypothetical protein
MGDAAAGQRILPHIFPHKPHNPHACLHYRQSWSTLVIDVPI